MSANSRLAIKNLERILEEFEQYFDDKADGTDDPDGGLVPNAEARLLAKVEVAKDALRQIYIPMTVGEFLKRVEERARQSKDVDIIRAGDMIDAVQLACRFCAWREAIEVREMYSMRNFIDLIQEGTPLGGPFKTEDDIKRYLDQIEEDWIEGLKVMNEEDPWYGLDTELDDFFGIRREEVATREEPPL